MTLRKLSLAVVFMIGSAVLPALAQHPEARIFFTTEAPFELRGTNVVLPAGNYILSPLDTRERLTYVLYHEDMRHSPVATIRTMRIIRDLGMLPGRTRMIMDIDESSPQTLKVLEGWNVPGEYGWEIISVTPSKHLLNSKIYTRR